VITTRNEAGAAMMAEATGKLTGRPGVALVTRGPGAANALPGLYIAAQDQSPMVLLVGLPVLARQDLPAFQTIDLPSVFAGLAKRVVTVTDACDLANTLRSAFTCAASGRPGPVVVGLPEDILSAVVDAPDITASTVVAAAPEHSDLLKLNQLLARAERPFVIAGSAAWSVAGSQALQRFAERYDLPVASAFRRQDRFDNAHPCYAGHLGLAIAPQLAAGLRAADVVIVFGQCLNEVTSGGFALLNGTGSAQKIVLIAADADAGSPPFDIALAISADPVETAEALAGLPTPGKTPPWPVWRRDLRRAYETTLRRGPTTGAVRLEEVIATLSLTLPDGAIVCNGAGNYAGFLHRYFVYRGFPGQLAPVSGSMGYGLPAAIAAQLTYPDRAVVALAGDGCFQMTEQELSTAVQLGLPLVIIVANNGVLGTILRAQGQRYPGRPIATSLVNPDFAALARACGALGFKVSETAQFAAALDMALASGRPALIDLNLSPAALVPVEATNGSTPAQ
jgi:acetolactate synthase-1/2/3 large subunit